MGIKKELSRIYRAKDCTDINDINIAINQVDELVKRGNSDWQVGKNIGMAYKRINSLYKKRDKLILENEKSGKNKKYKISLGDRIIITQINSDLSFSVAEAIKFLEDKYKSEKGYEGIEVQKQE
jgi:hypothetical protein